MGSPAKPFACTAAGCEMRFTNEDHLTVHGKKHDLELQLSLGNKSAIFPADQTPTPTRFIRNCEEVGLFQDLHVNPFDEGFKQALEVNKINLLASIDSAIAAATSDDALNTPHIFPNLEDANTNIFNTTTVISNVGEEATTAIEGDVQTGMTIENDPQVIEIESAELKKSDFGQVVSTNVMMKMVVSNDKDLNVLKKDVLIAGVAKAPVMSQKSLEYAIDSLTANLGSVEDDVNKNKDAEHKTQTTLKKACDRKETNKISNRGKRKKSESELPNNDYEVMLKLPSGEVVHMKSSEGIDQADVKRKLKDSIENRLKTDIETKLRADIETKINTELSSGNFIFKIQNAKAIPNNPIQNKVIQITSVPNYSTSMMMPSNVLIPVKKIAIPSCSFNKPKVKPQKNILTQPSRKKRSPVPPKHDHRPDCNILNKIGASCSLNCGNNSKNVGISNSEGDVSNHIIVLDDDDTNSDIVSPKPSAQTGVHIISNDLIVPADNTTRNNIPNVVIKTEIPDNLGNNVTKETNVRKRTDKLFKERRLYAVKRYREKQKAKMQYLTHEFANQEVEIAKLKRELRRYQSNFASLQSILMEHCTECVLAGKLREQCQSLLR